MTWPVPLGSPSFEPVVITQQSEMSQAIEGEVTTGLNTALQQYQPQSETLESSGSGSTVWARRKKIDHRYFQMHLNYLPWEPPSQVFHERSFRCFLEQVACFANLPCWSPNQDLKVNKQKCDPGYLYHRHRYSLSHVNGAYFMLEWPRVALGPEVHPDWKWSESSAEGRGLSGESYGWKVT